MNTPRQYNLMSPLAAMRRLLRMHRATSGRHLVLDVAERQIVRAEDEQKQAREVAVEARDRDDEGIALIEKVTADGKVTADEMPDVHAALRNFRRSRDLDQRLSEIPT